MELKNSADYLNEYYRQEREKETMLSRMEKYAALRESIRKESITENNFDELNKKMTEILCRLSRLENIVDEMLTMEIESKHECCHNHEMAKKSTIKHCCHEHKQDIDELLTDLLIELNAA